MPKDILVIIPAYNEGKKIASVVEEVRSSLGGRADILVVNDASTDNTASEIGRAGADRIDLITRVKYGAVLQTGFKYARDREYPFIATIDGDGQHDASFLPPMLQKVESGEADLLIGSRFIENTGYRMPLLRRIGSRLFSFLVRLFSGRKIFDPTSGYQLFNRKVLQVYCGDDYPVDYPDADVLLRVLYRRLRIGEIAVRMRPNPEKSMHSGLGVFYYVFKMFLAILIVVLSNRELKKEPHAAV